MTSYLPFLTWLFLLVQQLILGKYRANMILHFTKFRKLSKRSSINSVFFWVWKLLCETGVFILSSGNSVSVGVTVCHSGSLYALLLSLLPLLSPDLGLAVLSAGLLRAHSLNFFLDETPSA